jgi:hypothetical protein
MTISKKRVVLLAFALSAVGVMMTASAAMATHPRPLVAPKIVTSFVPAFDECTVATPPNRTHGPPLSGPSCNPPVKTSDALFPGANMIANGKLAVLEGAPGLPEDSDVTINVNISDVRCDTDTVGDSLACGNTNTSGGRDYIGALLALATIRITDHWNGLGDTGGTDPATVSDLPFGAAVGPCTNTASGGTGANCNVSTSANAVVGPPDPAVKDGQRGNVEISQIEILDGGVDGTPPDERFLVQGIFIP